MASSVKYVRVGPNSASIAVARRRIFDFFKTACRSIPTIMEVYNSDDVVTLSQLRSNVTFKIRKNAHVNNPKLVVSMRQWRSSSLFLKAAGLLYLVKPIAKQMVSMEWISLVLLVLEFGDQLQTLFSMRCSSHEAAYYFLNELVTGFDEDKNLENARQIISLGGLGLLVRRMDIGNAPEKSRAASVLRHCIRADGSCRHYLVKNLKKDAILALLVLENQANSHTLAVLSELLCISMLPFHTMLEFISLWISQFHSAAVGEV